MATKVYKLYMVTNVYKTDGVSTVYKTDVVSTVYKTDVASTETDVVYWTDTVFGCSLYCIKEYTHHDVSNTQ